MKALVVYYSRTGTTKILGEAIAKGLGAEAEELIDQKKRLGLRPFRWLIAGMDARRKKLTSIKVQKPPQDYDLILIGTPIWASRMTPAVRTYLESQNLEGKKVGLFCTGGNGDRERYFDELKLMVPKSTLVGTLGVRTLDVRSGAYVEKLRIFLRGFGVELPPPLPPAPAPTAITPVQTPSTQVQPPANETTTSGPDTQTNP